MKATIKILKSTSSSGAIASDVSAKHASQNSVRYPRLFSPLHLPDVGITLPNRALMGSMHTGLEGHSMPKFLSNWLLGNNASRNGAATEEEESLGRMATYFQERARGGVGLMVTGGIAPNMEGWTGPFSSQLTNEDEMRRHLVVTEAVHSVQIPLGSGNQENETVPARICLQILHTGRYSYTPFAVSASRTKSPISPFTARALTSRGIQRTVRDFIRTAALAKEAGYDGVEIMGSEG